MCVCINTHVYIYMCHFFVKAVVLRQCQWDTSCRYRRELPNAIVKMIFVLQWSRYGCLGFGKGSYYMGNLQGEAGGTREKVTGGTEGATPWSLHIHNNSKNPSKQSLVRE